MKFMFWIQLQEYGEGFGKMESNSGFGLKRRDPLANKKTWTPEKKQKLTELVQEDYPYEDYIIYLKPLLSFVLPF